MWGVLRRPSWVAFTVFVLVLMVAFVQLGRWQWRRHDERAAMNDRVAASIAQPSVPVDELLAVGKPPSADIVWREVTAVGRYDQAHELLVRNRQYDSDLGYEVVTPFVTANGQALLVDRGWVPSGDTATERPSVPPPPTGEVAITARVQAAATERTGTEGLPTGQVRQVAVPEIAAGLPYPVYGAAAALLPDEAGTGTGTEPPRAIVPPEPSGGPHVAYAIQWYVFVLLAGGGYVLALRNEVRTASGEAPRAVRDPDAQPVRRVTGRI